MSKKYPALLMFAFSSLIMTSGSSFAQEQAPGQCGGLFSFLCPAPPPPPPEPAMEAPEPAPPPAHPPKPHNKKKKKPQKPAVEQTPPPAK